MKKIILIYLIITILTTIDSLAAIRYVSHSGSNTLPYLTWETAADSIMSAINISSFGDTIYVANGVYEEQVVMIPGLSLIGAGMDSCIIDTRDLVNSNGFISVDVADSCILQGFFIKTYYITTKGYGIAVRGSDNVNLNKISVAWYGMYVGYTGSKKPLISNNIFDTVSAGIEIFNSSPIVKKNTIYIDPNSQSSSPTGIRIEAFDYTYSPLIDSNLIYANRIHSYSAPTYGIYKSFGASPIISNNTIIMGPYFVEGIFLSYSDTVKVMNNLIFGNGWAVENVGVQHLQVYNNYIGGEIGTGIKAGAENDVIINNVIANADVGIERYYGGAIPTVKYNNLWDNSINYSGFAADTTNLSVNPMVVNNDSTQGDLDFHLQMFSPLIDRGDPTILDKNGTRSDIGLYGGPFGESYKYLDLPPGTPVNFTALLDTDYIKLTWNRNTEADFSHYNLYRDTTENFTIDSTTFVASITDTLYLHIIPAGISNLYFRLTSVDNQGNQSNPSEELHIIITTVKVKEPIAISNYRLYQNYPNPFNPITKIGYRLKERGYVKLMIYDIKGELVETLVNKSQEGGYYEIEFSGTVGNPQPASLSGGSSAGKLASGVYIYQIMVRNNKNIPVFSDTKKMLMIK